MASVSLTSEGNAANYVDFLIETKTDFELYTSNYTMKIILKDGNQKFIRSKQSNRVFAAFRKLEVDIKTANVKEMGLEDVRYFQHDFKHPVYVERVCNIDLKSCYSNILFREKIISEATHKYLSGLPKRERLAAVGMLASRKEIFTFKNGKVSGVREERSENSRFFFFAVQKTFEMMNELKKICGKSYLFTWVDGIYFLPDGNKMERCEQYLRDIKFPFSSDYLDEFEVKFINSKINVTFKKDGDKKVFNLPIPDSAFLKAMQVALFGNMERKNSKLKSKSLSISNNKKSKK